MPARVEADTVVPPVIAEATVDTILLTVDDELELELLVVELTAVATSESEKALALLQRSTRAARDMNFLIIIFLF